MLRGSVQPAPPACRSRLRPAGYAVLPSRRSHTRAAPSVPRCAAHTQPPLWAWPAGSLTCAGRVGSSRRRALRYGGWAATFSRAFAGGGGVWDPLASLTEEPADASRRRISAPCPERSERLPHGRHGPQERAARRPRCPRARGRAGLRPERPHTPQERPEAPDGASGLAQPEVRYPPPKPGSRGACAGSQPPSAPAPQSSGRGSGTRPFPRALRLRLRARRSGRRPSPWGGLSSRRRARRLLLAAAHAPRHPSLGCVDGFRAATDRSGFARCTPALRG